MSTIQQLKTNHDTVIRQKTLPKSISTDNQADLFDGLADELLDRGMTQVVDTTALQALSGVNYKNVVVKDNGIYLYKSSGTPNGTTIFAATGGGVYEKQIGLIIDVTYSELVTLINGSDLIPGSKYRITDFNTRHFLILDGGNQDVATSFTGDIEHLIVTAISSNKISTLVYSEEYPQDIIYYDWNPENWLTDISFSDLAGPTIITGFKGVIFFRNDTINKNEFGYDFRNVKFRRYKVDPVAWNSGTVYVKGDIVKYTDGDTITYISLVNANTNNIPSVENSSFWITSINLTNTDKYGFWVNEYFHDIPLDLDIYEDLKTFDVIDYDSNVKNNKIYTNIESITILPNVVFNLIYSVKNNILNVSDASFTGFITDNKATGKGNCINTDFVRNDIKLLNNNLLGFNFEANSIDTMEGNIIGTNFKTNTIRSLAFYSNLIGNLFSNNIIFTCDGFSNNVISNFFRKNIIYADIVSRNLMTATIVYALYSKTIVNDTLQEPIIQTLENGTNTLVYDVITT